MNDRKNIFLLANSSVRSLRRISFRCANSARPRPTMAKRRRRPNSACDA